MGQFSWLDCIDNSQILDDTRADVYVLIPKDFGGGHIHETYYDGHGHFGYYDIYDLVAIWNREYIANHPDHVLPFYNKKVSDCQWFNEYSDLTVDVCDLDTELREIGIDISCYDEDNASLLYPIKITHDANAIYEDCKPSLGDPNQGWYTPPYDPNKRMPEIDDVIVIGDMSYFVTGKHYDDLMEDEEILYRNFDRDFKDDNIVYVYGETMNIWADDFNRNIDYECETVGAFEDGEIVKICGDENPNIAYYFEEE